MQWLDDSDAAGETSDGISRTLTIPTLRAAKEQAGARPGADVPLITFVPGDVVAERFEILRFLGQGGMGQVFEAQDLELGVSVALKVVRPDLASRDDVVRRFKSEVQLARQVTHPHVCRIYDLVYHRGTALRSWGAQGRVLLIVTMEMLRGETLGQRLKRAGAFSPDEALPLISQMAAALDAAHDVGIVHRDFKSANVMLVDSEEGEVRRAVVTDFGLAVPRRVARQGLAATSLRAVDGSSPVGGTPAYIAPELVAGHETGAAADVYSFGVVLYEMMTGLLPFRAETPEKTARLRLEADPTPPSRHRPELSSAWDAAILRCLSRDPQGRFTRAGEIVEALAGGTAPPRRKRWTRTALAAAIVAVVLASVLAFGGRWRPAPELGDSTAEAVSAVETWPSVAVLGMSEISGSSDSAWISTVLTEILTSELTAGGAQNLRAVPRENVDAWSQQARTTTGRLTPEDLRQAREQLDADFLIYGLYMARSNGSVQLDVRLWDGVAGQPLATVMQTGYENQVTELVSRIGEQFRSRLGLETPTSGVRPAARSLPAPAERSYEAGLDLLRRGEPTRAGELFDQALAGAPLSPVVLAARAEAWLSAGHFARAAAAARQAFELAADLPWRERLRIEGLYRRTVYDWPRARELYRALYKVFPENLDDALGLAAVETESGRPVTALETVDDLRHLFPATSDPRLDLAEAWAARALGDRERQRRAGGRAAAAAEALDAELLAVQGYLLEAEALDDLGATGDARTLETRLREILTARGDRLLLARVSDTWGQADLGLELPEVLALFRQTGDRLGEARTLIRQAYQQIVREEDFPGAEDKLRRALKIALETKSRLTEAEALNRLAILAYFRGDQHREMELFREAAEAARASGNLRLRAGILGNYAAHLFALGEMETAQEVLDETIRLARRVGSRHVLFLALLKSSWTLQERGETAGAEARLLEAERIARGFDGQKFVGLAASSLGAFYCNVDSAKARQFLETSVELVDPSEALGADLRLVRMMIDDARYAQAEEKLREVMSTYSSDDDYDGLHIRIHRALLLVKREKYEEARLVLRLIPDAHEDLITRHLVQRIKARVEAALGGAEQARASVISLVEEARAAGFVLQELEDRIVLGEIELDAGDAAAGRAELASVARRAHELGLFVVADRAERAAAF